MGHGVCFFEFSASDIAGTTAFYEQVFGWKFDRAEGGDLVRFDPGTGPGGALHRVDRMPPGGGVVFYIQVDDIDAATGNIHACGGDIIVPKTALPDGGWFAQFTDPDGNLVGLYTPAKPPATLPALVI